MKRFIKGADRTQVSLLPDCVDDYVSEDNPVRPREIYVPAIAGAKRSVELPETRHFIAFDTASAGCGPIIGLRS